MQAALKPCPECAQKTIKKPEMADKSLETDDSLTSELKNYESQHNGHNGTPPSQRINIIQEKIKADAADAMEKTCPMCGKQYSSQVSFNAFREHVEMHFIDDALELESENSIERQFEFVSHAVGDFWPSRRIYFATELWPDRRNPRIKEQFDCAGAACYVSIDKTLGRSCIKTIQHWTLRKYIYILYYNCGECMNT